MAHVVSVQTGKKGHLQSRSAAFVLVTGKTTLATTQLLTNLACTRLPFLCDDLVALHKGPLDLDSNQDWIFPSHRLIYLTLFTGYLYYVYYGCTPHFIPTF